MRDPTGHIVHYNPGEPPSFDEDVLDLSKQFMDTASRLHTLYELDEHSEALLALLDTAESPEETEAILAELNLNELLVQGKVEGYLMVIDELRHLAEGRKAAAKRMMQRAAMPERAAVRLKERLLEHMQRVGQKRIETQSFTARLQMNPPSADVYDEAEVPDAFKEVRVTVVVKAREIINHVRQTGEVVPGVTVSQREGIRIQ